MSTLDAYCRSKGRIDDLYRGIRLLDLRSDQGVMRAAQDQRIDLGNEIIEVLMD